MKQFLQVLILIFPSSINRQLCMTSAFQTYFKNFSFFPLGIFFFRNVNMQTCVQEKVGKEEDVLVETWIENALAFVTVGRNFMA